MGPGQTNILDLGKTQDGVEVAESGDGGISGDVDDLARKQEIVICSAETHCVEECEGAKKALRDVKDTGRYFRKDRDIDGVKGSERVFFIPVQWYFGYGEQNTFQLCYWVPNLRIANEANDNLREDEQPQCSVMNLPPPDICFPLI